MSFVPTIEIDLQALRCNLELVRRHAPNSRVMAVIKADGYGHGMLEVARALEEADALAVARVDEGVQLRHAQRGRRLVVLGGAHDQAEFEAAADAGLEVVVHHPHQIDLLARSGVRRPLRCWIKLDSGMHRLGFPPFECRLRLEQMRDMESAAEVVGILTHLANADDLGDDYTKKQFERFHEAVQGMGLPVSLANSAAVLGWPDTHADWVRPGIMLYGASPFVAPLEDLQPVMTFRSRLISVKEVERGAPVGYGGDWVAPERMPIGVVAAGYGDGYPREVPSGTPVLLEGRRVPIVGRVSMDTLMLDLRGVPRASVGDEVVLWGAGLPVEEIAQVARTIPYTLFCGVTPRVMRDYRS